MGIGLATLRLDGFASVQASHIGGTFTTVPYEMAGSHLQVNVSCPYGQLTAELQDDAFKPLPGYGVEQCRGVRTDSVAAELSWPEAPPLDQIGKPVRIRFQLNNARLYSFRAV